MSELTPEQVDQLKQFAPDHYRIVKDTISLVETPPAPDVAPFTLTIDAASLSRTLTMGEIEEIEDISGLAFSEAMSRFKGVTALVFVLRRKEDPKFTLKHAKAMTLGEMNAVLKPVTAEGDAPLDVSASPTA